MSVPVRFRAQDTVKVINEAYAVFTKEAVLGGVEKYVDLDSASVVVQIARNAIRRALHPTVEWEA